MGKDRRPNKDRKAPSKRSININEIVKDKGLLIAIIQGIVLSVVIAYLFYRSPIGLVAGAVVIPFWIKICRQDEANKKRAELLTEFKEYMMLIVAGLQAGYSIERAIASSEKELIKLYPGKCILLPYVHIMNQKIAMNIQLEKAFMDFANEIDIEEAISLAEIISFAKRSGGDYGKNIKETAFKIEENLGIKQEIETITTEKRLELKVMCAMPIGILLYITLTSKSFIAPLYGNMIGVALMTACLLIYGILFMLGRKIVEINV